MDILEEEVLTTGDVAKILGVNARKLQRFCNAGFVPGLRPTVIGGRRKFTPEQVEWLKQAVFLSRAGFSTKDLRKYVRLVQTESVEATEERLAMLRTHKRQVWQELEDLQATIDFLERQEELLK